MSQQLPKGTPIPIEWGANRVAGNLVFYADFRRRG